MWSPSSQVRLLRLALNHHHQLSVSPSKRDESMTGYIAREGVLYSQSSFKNPAVWLENNNLKPNNDIQLKEFTTFWRAKTYEVMPVYTQYYIHILLITDWWKDTKKQFTFQSSCGTNVLGFQQSENKSVMNWEIMPYFIPFIDWSTRKSITCNM
mgnify:CR=1 FL=1